MSTPIVIGGVNCYELWRDGRPESGRESFSRDKIRARRIIRCAWTDRLTLTRALMGGATSSGSFAAPAAYPDISTALCATVEIEGLGKSGQAGTDSQVSYTDAVLDVGYETPDYTVSTNPNDPNGRLLLTESTDYHAEFVTTPTASFVWTSDQTPLPPDAVPGKVMGMAEYVIDATRHPNPPWEAIKQTVGTVNNGPFLVLSRSWEDGKLLFLGTHDSRQFILDPIGNLTVKAYNVTYKWAYRSERWNTAFRPDTGQWEDFQTPAGNQLYKTGNHYSVF